MGACTTSSKPTYGNEFIPQTVYLHRSDKCLLRIEENNVEYQEIDTDTFLPEDSAILSSNGVFFVAGGTNSSGSLSASFLSIDSKNKAISELPDMPMPAKRGVLLHSGNWIYHVGGTGSEESVTSIMRYHLENSYWQDLGVLVSLINPGAYIFEDKIYVVGGKDHATGNYNKKVFFLSTHDLEFKLDKNLVLPLECENPFCLGGNTGVLIIVKDSTYKITSKNVKRMPKLPEPLKGNYPLELNGDRVVAFSYPKVYLSLPGASFWIACNISGKKEYRSITDKPCTVDRDFEPQEEKSRDSNFDNGSAFLVPQDMLQNDSDKEIDDQSEREINLSQQSYSNKSISSNERFKLESPQESEEQNFEQKNETEENSSDEEDKLISHKTIVRKLSSSSEEEPELPLMKIDIQSASKKIEYGKGEKISSSSSSGSEKNRFRPPSAFISIQKLANPEQNHSAQINGKGKIKNVSSNFEEDKISQPNISALKRINSSSSNDSSN